VACPAPKDTTPATGDTEMTGDTDTTPDTGEPLPERLPFEGSFTVSSSSRGPCTGDADAIIIGAVNIVGNAECTYKDGKIDYVTISGNRSPGGSAKGSVAINKWFTAWSGEATANVLTGEFEGEDAEGMTFSGAFSLTAEDKE